MTAPLRAKPGRPAARYEDDLHAWALEQAALLRAGRLAEIDLEHIAEEIEDVGRSEYRRLESALTVLLMHMLKWDHQPEARSRSWEATIREQRRRVLYCLADNPSLNSRLEQAVRRAYDYGRDRAWGETGLELSAFPVDCPYAWEDMIEREFSAPRL